MSSTPLWLCSPRTDFHVYLWKENPSLCLCYSWCSVLLTNVKMLPPLVGGGGASDLPVITSCLPWSLEGWANLVGLLGKRKVLKQRSCGCCYIVSESAPLSIGQGTVCMEFGVRMLQLQNCPLVSEGEVVAGRRVNGHHSDIFLRVSSTPHLPEESTGFP